jgi:hypothetical protein
MFSLNPYVVAGAFGLVCVLAIFGLVKLFRVFDSPDGERILRMRTQGPYVPLNAKDSVNKKPSSE